MLISWDWIGDYVSLERTAEEVAGRLTMSGLNLESIETVGGDLCVDLEVTSNRPDCLGHIGVAREIAALYRAQLTCPDPKPRTGGPAIESAVALENRAKKLCPQYIARVIRGVKVGPSPEWLVNRLATIGQKPVNNVVDITNYVLMECGQPLHAFDLAKLRGPKIVVRAATKGETIVAIDQKEYPLTEGMCVIADAERPVAVAGVMGGLDTEISEETVDVLVETAAFQPLSVRNTARALKLFSDSSYRFERGVDLEQLDWASRRCCELILEIAGGELLEGSLVAGADTTTHREPIELRYPQIERVLGIPVPGDEARDILERLGMQLRGDSPEGGTFSPPSWRRDLTREIDLIEEVARIHGYDRIPGDAPIKTVPSSPSRTDRVTDLVRDTLTANGLYECITLSFVDRKHYELFTPRPDVTPLQVEHSTRKHENLLRQSLIPSLLEARRENERRGQFNVCLFEIAKVYLSTDKSIPENDAEPWRIGLVCGGDVREIKGVLESLAERASRCATVSAKPSSIDQFSEGRGAELSLNGQMWGWCGELSRSVQEELDLRDAVCVAEVDLAMLIESADLMPNYEAIPQYPPIERDLNFVLDETVTWETLADVVRGSAGGLLESIGFGGQYRGKQIAADKKSYVVTLSFRSPERTLTSDEVDAAVSDVVAACTAELQAELR